MQEAESLTRALFRQGERAGKAAPLERAGQVEIRDLHGCKERNREVQELEADTGAVSGKGYYCPVQVQGADGRDTGRFLFLRRIHVQGFGDRPQF